MGQSNRMRGAIPLPEAGEGLVLRFLSKDRLEIQEQYGDAWLIEVERLLSQNLNEKALVSFLKLGIKDKDGKPVEVDIDDIDLPQIEIATKIMDAVCMGAFGRDTKQQLEWLLEQQAKVEGKQSPPASPETS